jgi:hypothetical protein
MKEDFEILKAIASEMNLKIQSKTKLCKQLKNQLTQQNINLKFQEIKKSVV